MIWKQEIDDKTISFYQQKLSKKGQHVSKSWLTIFEEKVVRHPDMPAVINPKGETLTYTQVDNQSKQIASYLQENFLPDVDANNSSRVIAVVLSRGNIVIAPLFVAILKLGAAVYFIEPMLGDSVNQFRLDKIGPDFLIADKENRSFAEYVDNIPQLILEEHLEKINAFSEKIKCNWQNEQKAVVVCSSGTTDQPKVMALPLSRFADLSKAFRDVLRVRPGTRFLQLARRNFDATSLEILIALGNGATLVLMSYETSLNSADFETFVKVFNINCFFITPSHISHLLGPNTSLATVESMAVGGEAFTTCLVKKLVAAKVKRIFNSYGPTECGMIIMSALLYDSKKPDEMAEMSLGEPFYGTDIRVVRQNPITHQWEMCSPGQQGELFVSNEVSNVYVSDDNNELKYVQVIDPITGQEACFFKTGDIATITDDGRVVFGGRKDNQVKIFGQLVVTDEVANHFERVADSFFPEQKNQVYINVERNTAGNPTGLHAYYTANNEEKARMIVSKCAPALHKVLPKYMIPKQYFWLPEFKIEFGSKLDTEFIIQNGKVSKEFKADNQPLTNDVERGIAEIWSDILETDRAWNREDKFTDFGGDSLLKIAMFSSISETFSVQMRSSDFAGDDSISNIAVEIELAKLRPTAADEDTEYLIPPSKANILMRIRTSDDSKYALYILHPGIGHIQIYPKIVEEMPETFSIYGVRVPGSEPGEELAKLTVEEFAEEFSVRIINEHKLNGKAINLMGFCGGSMLALATARVIQEKGYEVYSLTLADAPNPFNVSTNHDTATWLATLFNDGFGLSIDREQLRSSCANYSEQFDFCFNHAAEQGLVSKQKHEEVKERLMETRTYLYAQELSDLARSLFEDAFGLKVTDEQYLQHENFMKRLEFLSDEALRQKLMPTTLKKPYFIRVLTMGKVMRDCAMAHTPLPLTLPSGRVQFVYTSPNLENPMAWYPLYDTWKELIPQASKHQIADFDHYNVTSENLGARCLINHIRRVVE